MLQRILSSSLLSIGGNFIVKFIGIFSTMVMARLLVPEDFGLVALATVVYEFFLTLGRLGSQNYILKQKDVSDSTYNSTFTFRFINLSVLAVVLIFVAPYVADFYQKDIITSLLYVYAACLFLQSFENIYLISFMREMNYKPIIQFNIYIKVITVIANISLAFWLGDYRAIIYGVLIGVVLSVTRSYFITKLRPKLDFSNIADNWRFSRWLLLEVLVGYSRGKADIAITGYAFSTQQLGFYEVSKKNGGMTISEIATPLENLMLTTLTEQGNKNEGKLGVGLEKIFVSLAFLLSPILVGSYLYMDIIVPVLLGNQWIEAIPLCQFFLVLAYCSAFINLLSRALIAGDMVDKYVIFNSFVTLLLIGMMLYIVTLEPSLEMFTEARMAFGVFALLSTLFFLRFFIQFSVLNMLASLGVYLLLSTLFVYIGNFVGELVSEHRMVHLLFAVIFSGPLYFFTTRGLSPLLCRYADAFKAVDILLNLPLKLLKNRN